jgi:hypothetical protein
MFAQSVKMSSEQMLLYDFTRDQWALTSNSKPNIILSLESSF